jgi:NTE family protein
MRRAVRRLKAQLPGELHANLDWRLLDSFSCDAAVTIVQLIHRRAAFATQSNDYDFSRYTEQEHWQAGRADVVKTLGDAAWKNRVRPTEGVMVLDLTRDLLPPSCAARNEP